MLAHEAGNFFLVLALLLLLLLLLQLLLELLVLLLMLLHEIQLEQLLAQGCGTVSQYLLVVHCVCVLLLLFVVCDLDVTIDAIPQTSVFILGDERVQLMQLVEGCLAFIDVLVGIILLLLQSRQRSRRRSSRGSRRRGNIDEGTLRTARRKHPLQRRDVLPLLRPIKLCFLSLLPHADGWWWQWSM